MAAAEVTATIKVNMREARKLIADVRREVKKVNASAKRALKLIDTFAWSAVRCDNPKATKELQRRIDVCRAALKSITGSAP